MALIRSTTLGTSYSTSTEYILYSDKIDKKALATCIGSTITTVTTNYVVDAKAVDDSMIYVQSMSQEELMNFRMLIIEKEQELTKEQPKIYIKK